MCWKLYNKKTPLGFLLAQKPVLDLSLSCVGHGISQGTGACLSNSRFYPRVDKKKNTYILLLLKESVNQTQFPSH